MVDIDIPVSAPLQKALQPLSCTEIALPLPKPLKVSLPFGGSMNALVDMSKGIPNDCSMNFNLMIQIAPLLAALECPMKILKLLKPLIDIVKAVPSLDPIKIGEAMPAFVDAAAEVAPCFVALAQVPIMVMDLLRLIRSVLNCLLGQLETLRNLMNGLALRFGEAEGNADLLATLECSQKNAMAQAQALTSSIDPIAGVLALVSTIASIAGMNLDIKLETGGAPPETTEALDGVIAVLRTAVDAITAIVGE
ncbi:MAG TPA: hypothetical protein VFW55_11410 [Propionicimonas sp.]|nr:hypothetical protein [Propionicimonas sp.]